MKIALLLVTLLFGTAAQASSYFKATVIEGLCVEVDPFLIGDACIVNLRKENGDRLSLILDFDEFQDIHGSAEELEGESVFVNDSKLRKIYDEKVVEELRSMDDSYFYLYADVDALEVIEVTSENALENLVSQYRGFFFEDRLPAGYRAQKVSKDQMNVNFMKLLNKMTSEKKKDWKEFVMESGEYGDEIDELRQIARRPVETLGVDYLLEVGEFFMITYDGELVGYFVEVSDHVQAAIYQDGAWINMFLDASQSLVKKFDESA